MTATTTRTGAYRMCGVLVMLAGAGGSAAGQDLPDRVEWCGTEWSWRQRVEAGIERQEAVAGGCPLNGVCDDPATRNGFIPDGSTPIKVIRLRFVIFSNDDGSNPATTLNGVADQVARMNADFEPHRIRFTYSTAFVDDSTFRQLVLAEEDVMKNLYAVAPESQCNIFVTDLQYGGFIGFGDFPWSSDVLTATSGVIIDGMAFGHGEQTMTHEIGHALGLWHTHHGVTEQLPLTCNDDGNPCDCACYEEAAPFNDDVTGDFCVDTPPTPTNFDCTGPGGTDPCSNTAWGPTQPENFMGYAGSPCWSLFTPQQAERLHCWLDVVLSGWLVTNCPGTGNCYSANGTPGCSDPQCCAAVCAIDPFCCNNQWDAQCANEADTECGPVNNDCEDASPVAGNTSFPFSTINATTDGPPHPVCQKDGDEQVNQDIWYSYTAPCDGFLTVSTCGTADFDTKLAIYRSGTACPLSDDDLLACEDDAPGCPGFTSELTVQVAGGATYLVRIGGFLNETGSGTISFSCEPHCGSPATGSCFTAHPLPGCDDAGCCQTVCAQDPFCCRQTWDAICVNEAIDLCWNCGPGSGSCWEPNGTPGCGPTGCCATVCTVDPFCCDNTWDQLCADRLGEVVPDPHRLSVIRADGALVDGERPLEPNRGLVSALEFQECPAQPDHRPPGAEMVRPGGSQTDLNGLPVHRLGLGVVVSPQFLVDVADAVTQERFGPGLVRERGVEFPGGLIDSLDDGHRGTVAPREGCFQEVDLEEPTDGLEMVSPPLRCHLVRDGLLPERQRHRGRRDQHDEDHGDSADQRRVATGEVPHLVQRRGGPGDDRLVVEVPAYVGGEIGSALVAPLLVLLQGLGEDRLHVTAQGPVPLAQPGRRLVLDHPRALGDRPAGDVVREPAAEKLVPDDTRSSS